MSLDEGHLHPTYRRSAPHDGPDSTPAWANRTLFRLRPNGASSRDQLDRVKRRRKLLAKTALAALLLSLIGNAIALYHLRAALTQIHDDLTHLQNR